MPAPATCLVSGVLYGAGSALLTSVKLVIERTGPLIGIDGEVVSPTFGAAAGRAEVTTHASTAAFSVALVPGPYRARYQTPEGATAWCNFAVPDGQSTADFADLIGTQPTYTPTLVEQAEAARNAAQVAATNSGNSAASAAASASAAAASAGLFVYASVAAVKADTFMTYTAGQPGTVAPGFRFGTIDGAAYEVLASGASAFDLANANDVRLRVLRDMTGALGLFAFGPAADRVTDDTAVFQKAIDALTRLTTPGEATVGGGSVRFLSGAARINGTVELKLESKLILGDLGTGSEIDLHSPTVGFSIGFNNGPTVAERVANAGLMGGRLRVIPNGATGVGVKAAFAPFLRDLDFDLRGNNQVALDIQGSGGIAPYYGSLSGLRVTGTGTGTGNVGLRFRDDPTAASSVARGVNRWDIPSIRHISTVGLGIDVQSANGLYIGAANMENLRADAVYEGTAVRFNHRPDGPDYTGSVTSVASSQIIDTGFVYNSTFAGCTVVVLTGPNAGCARRIESAVTGTITFGEHFPYNFGIGDTYEIYKMTALEVQIDGLSCETAPVLVDFRPGAAECKVETYMRTIASGNILFRRGSEDVSNTIARRTTTAIAFGQIAPGQTINMTAGFTSGTRGGFVLPQTGWLDSFSVTGAVGAFNRAGTITVEVLVDGVAQQHVIAGSLVNMQGVLTPRQSNDVHCVRRSLTNAQVITRFRNIIARATASADLAVTEQLTVQLHFGHL